MITIYAARYKWGPIITGGALQCGGGGALKSGTICENADLRFNSTGIKSKCNNSRQASLIQEHPGQLELASGMQK